LSKAEGESKRTLHSSFFTIHSFLHISPATDQFPVVFLYFKNEQFNSHSQILNLKLKKSTTYPLQGFLIFSPANPLSFILQIKIFLIIFVEKNATTTE
jgi:hypothetical protein